ncbi:unnamed protein product [Thelazia callipaeda]|uniref:FZ domain-containing protein n=1 Tax=Thelazia callipaeda TaxID=103827 RepID=A0A0N5DAU8_THECL|nr:unnamed protein product [Thelazia callipaeda]
MLDLWSVPPCINWCYYAQLACPHLATTKVVDYAGHPSFQCRDLYIPQVSAPRNKDQSKLPNYASKKKSSMPSKCACLHPCDFGELPDLAEINPELEQNRPITYSNSLSTANDEAKLKNKHELDFFPAAEHCTIRRHICGSSNYDLRDHHVVYRSSAKDVSKTNANVEMKHTVDVNNIASTSIKPSDDITIKSYSEQNQKILNNQIGYISQWWTKHRARRRFLFTDKSSMITYAISSTTTTTIKTTVTFNIITNTSTTIKTTTFTSSSGVNWRISWSTYSGNHIYTLFFFLLLLRRPPVL